MNTKKVMGAKPINRRDALRFSVSLALGSASFLTASESANAQTGSEISLQVTESTAGWSSPGSTPDSFRTATDDKNKPAVVWTSPAEGGIVTVSCTLGAARANAVARSRQLRFRYRIDGPASALHFKIGAAPLASGYSAVYRLPYPQPGRWRDVVLLVQEYNTVWDTNGPLQAEGNAQNGQIQIRIAKTAGSSVTLTIGEIWIEPLPKNAPINTSTDPNPKNGVKSPSPNAPKLPDLVTLQVKDSLGKLPYPRLMFSAAKVSDIRNRAKTTEIGQAALAGLVKRGDVLLAQAVEIPDRGGQWDHLYVCPKHGPTLRPDGPHKHVCSVDNEVFTGFPYDEVLLTGVHQRYAESVRDLGLLFQLTGDANYASKAREILTSYGKKYRSLPVHDVNNKTTNTGGRAMSQTVAEAQWLIPLAQGCDLVWETLTSSDRDLLRVGLFYPAVTEIIQKQDSGVDSDQCWRNAAIGLTGVLFGDAALLSDALDNPARGFQAQISRGATDDGFWYDKRWSYHFEALEALMPLAEAAQNAGADVYKNAVGERYKKMYLLPVEMAMPDQSLPAFDDNSWASAKGNPLYETASARWNDKRLAIPVAKVRASAQAGLAALLYGSAADFAGPTPRLASANFPDAGYAILRAGEGASPAYLAVKYGPDGGAHGHTDKLSFVFWAQDRILFDDPGQATRGSAMETNWNKTTFAHNTLVVDETNQKPATGKCLAFQTGDTGSAVLADAGPIYDGIQFRRAVFLLNTGTADQSMAVVIDMAEAARGRTPIFDFVLHPSGAWTTPLPSTGMSGGVQKPGYSLLRDVVTVPSLQSETITFDFKPDARVVVAPAQPSGVSLMRANGVGKYGAKSDMESAPCLVVRQTGTSRAAQTSLLVCGPQSATGTLRPALVLDTAGKRRNDAQAVVAALGGKRYLLVANPDAVSVWIGDDYKGSDKLAIVPLKSA